MIISGIFNNEYILKTILIYDLKWIEQQGTHSRMARHLHRVLSEIKKKGFVLQVVQSVPLLIITISKNMLGSTLGVN